MTAPQDPYQQSSQPGDGHQQVPPAQGYQQPPPQGYGYQQGYAPPPPPKKRKVWPWVLLAVFMVPVLFFVACSALVGGAVKAVDDARAGGTVAIGEEFSYASGLKIAVTQPQPHSVDNEFIVGPNETAYEATVTVTNGTDQPVGAALITMNATVNSAPAERVFDDAFVPTQDIAPGQRLAIPFRFKVKEGTTGPLQIAVTDAFNEPVFFNGTL
ncbi:hypothetical protein [Pseudonocardia sp. H11422]|uniref:hypothetical protein n=1 Tax=Pseudonocardia sp. H11422 TaxID=2835866 RepID=UPI001BDDC603|nr:hypothetical protein [Pseudonocardia sp. H11422]